MCYLNSPLLKVVSQQIGGLQRGLNFALFFCLALISFAQDGSVRGVVPGADGAPNLVRTNSFAIDTYDRDAVRNLFNAVFYSGADIRSGWNGSVADCDPGDTSPEFQEAVLTRINFYRAMAGVPADIQFDPALSAKARQAALMVSANSSISHEPPPSFSCYTPEGAEAALNSNLAYITSGIDSIEAYIMDSGPNERVGHRRWLLYPQTELMGNGDIDPPDGSSIRRANANWVIDDKFGTLRPPTRDGFVAWPPPGFVPYKIVYPRWSFSLPGADFSAASVSVATNGIELPVSIEPIATGYGENSIVFVPGEVDPAARITASKPEKDIAFHVTISNVVVGSFATNFTYAVTVFDPDLPIAPLESTILTGSAQPEIGRPNRFRTKAVANASSYDFRVGTLQAYRRVETGDSTENFIENTSGLYPVARSAAADLSNAAFHLAHSSPSRPQSLMLKSIIVPSWRGELTFRSRLAAASTGQVARVQVSVDEGATWQDVYSQLGDGSNGEMEFTEHAVSLGEFDGRAIRIRFEYGFPFGTFSYVPGAEEHIGWFIDDIAITGSQELFVHQRVNEPAPEFRFIPLEQRTYYLDSRPRFYGQFLGEWTAGKLATAVAPAPYPTEVRITGIRFSGTSTEIEFETSQVESGAAFQIEESANLSSGWSVVPAELIDSSDSTRSVFRVDSRAGARFFRVTIE